MATNKHFRLRKSFKRILALMPFKSNELRDAFKHSLVDAQVAADTVVRREKKDNRTAE